MHHGAYLKGGGILSERKQIYSPKMIKIGKLIEEKRKIISSDSRERFIEERSEIMFCNESWISLRHLANIEEGKNLPSIEMLIKLAIALEVEPIDLFGEIYSILSNQE